MLGWLLASLHLLALGIGLGAVVARARALGGTLDGGGLRRVFFADNLWALAAVIWISTGLLRAFAGIEKGSSYYLQNDLFLAKMALLGLILALEVRPMVTLIRWRIRTARGEAVGAGAAALARTSAVQAVLVVLMVLAAAGMARGLGA